MAYLGSFAIDDYVGIPAATHRFSSGAAYAPTVLTYSIYEEATAVGLDEDVDMVVASPFDSIAGCYWVRRQLTTAAGFESGKNYMVLVKATVDSVSAITMHTFQVQAKVTAATVSDKTGYTASTVSDKTGYSLSSSQTFDVTGSITGNLSGSVGSVSGAVGSVTAGVTLAASAVQAIWDAATSALTTAGSIGKRIVDYLTGDAYARLGAPAGASIAADIATRASQTSVDTVDDFLDTEVAAIKAKTDNLPADPADASDVASSFSTVNSTLSTIAAYIDTEVAAIKAKTDNLPASPAATGDIPSAATIADAVWDEASTGHTDAGKAGAQVWTDIDAILADTGTDGVIVATNNDKTGYSLATTPPTAAAIADAVWDEATTGHTTSGTFGEQVKTDVDAILADTGTDGVAVADKTGYALTSGERDSIAAAALDLANGVETDWTLRQALRIILAALSGKLAGAATSEVTIKNPPDSKTRITATVDADGNRTAVTYDKT
jgi:hypothetical protein